MSAMDRYELLETIALAGGTFFVCLLIYGLGMLIGFAL